MDMIRDQGVRSLSMDMLYGLPHQTRGRMAASVQKLLSLSPDRLALYGYAHVPWMAKRQVLIDATALPDSEERLDLFEAAARMLVWDGYKEVGIDHFAREGDPLEVASREGRMRRNFQGYTEDGSQVLIGLGASAISRYPQGYTQNASTSSSYAQAIKRGRLATERGHAMSADDMLRADMIERLMCRFELDLPEIAAAHGVPVDDLLRLTAPLRRRFAGWTATDGEVIALVRSPRLIARLAALALDAYAMPEGRHSRAL
ncbi:Coproporphyrinogen III oxidase, oxygen-independent [Rubellimicrobium mesophilum DSM 19309]|uniref:Coproporphyrinogen III oxidase, oxygen-independent n=1 Tax=Rubellimicrobium mesophilum DSM 19309 TaxID=442562 RepID=A0A017HME4_9RHOB|nr:Coproporphyrinogen III oxidase, oxygen-independent [Rubellimicrobium mesophilum DSM 19309]